MTAGPVIAGALYVLGAFLTFGYGMNHFDIYRPPYCERTEGGGPNCSNAIPALAAGAIWPVYWAGVISIEVMK